MACCEKDHGWTVWNIESGQITWSRKHLFSGGLAWLSELQNLVCWTGGDDRTLQVWDIASNASTGSVAIDNEILSVACNPAENLIAVGDYFHTVHFVDAHNCREVHRERFREPIASFTWSEDGRSLAVGQYQRIDVYDWPQRHSSQQLLGHWDVVKSVAWQKDNRAIVSASFDRTVRIWDLDKVDESASGDTRFRVTSPGKTLVASLDPSEADLTIVSTADWSTRQKFTIDAERFARITWTPDSQFVCCNAADGSVHVCVYQRS